MSQATSDIRIYPACGGTRIAPRRAWPVVFALACVLVVACALIALPGRAFAEEYEITKVDITADAQSDGSLHIVEQRTFDLSGAFTHLEWNLRSGDFTVNSVQIGTVSEEGDTTLSDLQQVGFDLNWREDEQTDGEEEAGPGYDSYSIDVGRGMLYTFFNASDQQVLIQTDYTVENGVTAYRDCADLYWQYIGMDWEADSHDVTCRISLPVPAGVQPVVGDTVYAWGHGPADGTVEFNDSDTVVTYHTDCVPQGSFAEARVVFPRTWLVNISDDALKASGNVLFKDQIIAAEKKWVDGDSWRNHYAYIYLIALGSVSAALLLYALIMLARHGRAQKRTFTQRHWRDEPHRGVHPAVIGRLYRANRESRDDVVATVLHLANIGAITVSKGSYDDPAGGRVRGYYVNRVAGAADRLDNEIDRKAIEMLFGTVAEGRDALWLSGIEAFGDAHPSAYSQAMEAWQRGLSTVVEGADYFDPKAMRRQRILAIVGVLYAVFSLVLAWLTGNYVPLAFMLPTALVLFIASDYMPHLTRQGANDLARCEALKRWFLEFAERDEDVPDDEAKWKSLLVYAYEFGVAAPVVRQLREVDFGLFQHDADLAREHDWFVPWYAYYDADDGAGSIARPGAQGAESSGDTEGHAKDGSPLPCFADALSEALERAQHVAEKAIANDERPMRTDEPDAI